MIETILNFLGAGGIMQFSIGELLLTGLVLTQVTIASVTIYLHRHQAHRGLDLHPVIAHFFRFWLWLATGIVTREWVAIHRKHHAKCEKIRTAPRWRGSARCCGRGTSYTGKRRASTAPLSTMAT